MEMKITLALSFFMAIITWTVCQADEEDVPKCDHIGYSPFTIRKEICGSDGQTYSNDKHLEFENCLYKREIKKAKNGWCKEEDQKRADEQRRKLIEEYVKKLEEIENKG
ncbi:uncharacterized protein LOC110834725 [Zootermopsis nevadensis]|uniref:Kazal-like domain-containing protein n=1 Tax=Zootermopsis nevadensis TaxID=136037 RepID=A0A067QVW6_ZOONE|nr:uncharacterized protein LOC110834725 [Zootermopsis nevadensis]KDR14194.1 hypothetical protein L798_11602 [Zootermopsis nevadensis]